ncbi:MAG: phenylacetic acid degradation protein PaaY [Alphaproteobacteria bacterium]|nr:phenylacetic acid degradation protein PaaY [Alphaproteobacteria bacterium]
MENIYSIDGIVPVVDPSAFVHPSATIIGDVIVGKNCYVGPGAALRGDMGRIVMEPRSNMQDGCIAHTFAGGETLLEEAANVGHGAVLHGCHLGKGVLIGMNAVIMDGAHIGDHAFVAALAFVKANFSVPSRSIVAGIPAKIVSEVSDEELRWKQLGDEDYQDIIRRSHASLKKVQPLTSIEDAAKPRVRMEGIPPLYQYREQNK